MVLVDEEENADEEGNWCEGTNSSHSWDRQEACPQVKQQSTNQKHRSGPRWTSVTTPATCVSLSTSIITPFAMEGLEFRRLMANAIKNFHFCFVDTSLSKDIKWCIWKKTGAEVPQMSAIYFFRFTEPNNRIMARIFPVKYFFDSTPCCSVPEWRLCRDFKGYSFGVSVFAAWLNTCCSKRSHRRCISRVYHSF